MTYLHEATGRRRAASAGALEVRNISVRYGRQAVVEDVSFDAPRNAITALIGPSGCGKSTVLSCINRLTDMVPGCCVDGSVGISWLRDTWIERDVVHLRRQVGMLFQRPNPFPFSIWRNLEFALKQHGVKDREERDDRIKRALEEVGLWEEVRGRLQDSAMALSGGQQQRLCLARALVLNPTVMLMDEPCSALDPIATQRIEELIQKLSTTHTVLMVTHSLAQARRLASKLGVMWKVDGVGRMIEFGDADAIFEDPAEDLTSAYLKFA
ncbi:phosphate ABC transporter ATP-binding protein [Pelomonas sp. APW6]|uniref:Phosphate ABC transporter ATP-binding protein n=1 Tax=Roseateles subflavus TaxID=3053353 RepID=A0ABT7LP62_9BURK|nr:phosphate ABC transporter ATP-binding protein [Pelomonas sp. APW6]MDL5034669.1 phosphate ABC transporter ATP-binding protein [Pelomonas sp. APW6]